VRSDTTDLPPVPSPYEGKRLTVLEHLSISCFWFGTNFLWGSVLPLLIPDAMLRLAPEQPALAAGSVVSIGAINGLVVPLIAGAFSDRCASPLGRRRPYIASGVSVFVVGLLLMLAAYYEASLPMFFAGYFVLNVGINVANAAYAGIIPDVVPADQRGIASGYMGVMTMAGAATGAILIGALLQRGSHLMAYVSIIVALGVVTAVTLKYVREHPLPCRPEPIRWVDYIKSLWIDPRRYPDFAWVWISRALVMLGFYSIPHIVLYFLRDAVGVEQPKALAGQVMACVIAGAAVSAMLGGAVSDRIGRKKVVYLANTFMGLTSLGLAFVHNFYGVVAIGFLFGLGYGAYISVDWALGTDTLPKKTDAGKQMAVWHVAQELPHILAAVIAAAVLSNYRVGKNEAGEAVYDAAGYSAVFAMASVFVLIGAVLLRNVRGVR
jgi:MFS family permease